MPRGNWPVYTTPVCVKDGILVLRYILSEESLLLTDPWQGFERNRRLRQLSCKLANDLQECFSRVRRDSTSASAPEPAVLHIQFCRLLCALLDRFGNRVVLLVGESAVGFPQD